MSEPINPAERPSRIHVLGQIAVTVLLGGSFLSGLLVWWGQAVQLRELQSPDWLRPALVLHGTLNPFLCGLFGALAVHHIRIGWAMRANLISGLAMEAVFAGLILSGIGLYYIGDADWRGRLVWTHRVLGLSLPVTLAAHWLAGLWWGRKISQPTIGADD